MNLDYGLYFKIKEQLKLHESYEAFPYKDTEGKTTIGIGHNLDDRGLSDRVIDYIFDEDITVASDDLDRIGNDFGFEWRSLSEARQLVLLDMSFNLGYDRLSKFKRTLGYIAKGMFKEAAIQMRHSKWHRQVKGRAVRLERMMEVG